MSKEQDNKQEVKEKPAKAEQVKQALPDEDLDGLSGGGFDAGEGSMEQEELYKKGVRKGGWMPRMWCTLSGLQLLHSVINTYTI